MPEILTSIHGRRLGLTNTGALAVTPDATVNLIPRLLGNITAAGTALTASSTETALGAITIPANRLDVGSLIQVRFQGIATATNSTDTLTVKLYIGGIGGTALISMAATDVANDNVFTGEYEIAIRTIGSSGTMVGAGTFKSIPAAEGTMTIKDDILASTAIDTTASKDITVSGTWSSTNAGNSCRLDFFRVFLA